MSSEQIYLDTLRQVLVHGRQRPDRTGTGTISLFGTQMRFDIADSLPVITTKQLPWKHCIKELLWFLNGSTDAKLLQAQGVKIWDGNSSREFLDARGLGQLPEGDIGAGYGFQWRHFGAEYIDCHTKHEGGVDQVHQILDQLRNDPFSRRIFLSSWNPQALPMMALPPCHLSAQFYVDQDENGDKHLSCHMYQRSVDLFLGEPWNIMSYAVLTYIFAQLTNMKPKELIISTGDTHIYLDHIEQVKEQLTRTPFPPPTLKMSDTISTKPMDQITIDDFELIGYQHHPAIKAKMSV